MATGIPNLFLGWIPMACGAKGYTSKIYMACIANIVVALGAPMMVNTMEQMARSTNLEMLLYLGIVLSCGLALATVVLSFALALSPALMAWREKLPSSGLIIGLTLFSIILPILWIPALIVASLAVTKKQAAPIVQLIKEQRQDHKEEQESKERRESDG
jgi:uncharacterized protein YacL